MWRTIWFFWQMGTHGEKKKTTGAKNGPLVYRFPLLVNHGADFTSGWVGIRKRIWSFCHDSRGPIHLAYLIYIGGDPTIQTQTRWSSRNFLILEPSLLSSQSERTVPCKTPISNNGPIHKARSVEQTGSMHKKSQAPPCEPGIADIQSCQHRMM